MSGCLKLTLRHPDCKSVDAPWISQLKVSPVTTGVNMATTGWDGQFVIWRDLAGVLQGGDVSQPVLRSRASRKVPRVAAEFDVAEGKQDRFINSMIVSPDGTLAAVGGRGFGIPMYDLNQGELLYTLRCASMVHAMVFSPNRYVLRFSV